VSDGARERLRTTDLERRDLDTVMELLSDQMGDLSEFTVEERSPKRLRIRVTRCSFAEEMRRLDASDIGEAHYCAYDQGFCEGLNPTIRFTRTKTLMAGDDCCNHTYVLADEAL
jgi:fumarate reductase iron-sulfur subunit